MKTAIKRRFMGYKPSDVEIFLENQQDNFNKLVSEYQIKLEQSIEENHKLIQSINELINNKAKNIDKYAENKKKLIEAIDRLWAKVDSEIEK